MFGSVSSDCDVYGPNDVSRFRPRLLKRQRYRDGLVYETRYSRFDPYNQPQDIAAQTYPEGVPDDQHIQTVTREFWDHPTFTAGFPVRETICIDGDCRVNTNAFDGQHGKVTRETRSAVTTAYTYHPDGNLLRQTDAQGSYIAFHDYDLGVAQTLDLSGVYSLAREPDLYGRVVRQALGDRTYQWAYDQLGRLTRYTPPTGAPSLYTYAPDSSWRQSARLGQVHTTHVDGFDRPTVVVDPVGAQTLTRYDAFGREVFRSYPHASKAIMAPGETREYDAIDRLTRVIHARGTAEESERSYAYGAEGRLARVTATNERGFDTVQLWEYFGDVDDRRLLTLRNANGDAWHYTYNVHDSLTSVDAPGTAGDYDYHYDHRNFLTQEVHPAKGITRFGRDAVGNMIWREDARDSQRTWFHYDPLHRIDLTDYPGHTPDIDPAYDLDRIDQITREAHDGTLVTQQTFDYEARGDRLVSQTLDVGSQRFTTQYQYDDVDCLRQITYPTTTTPIEYRCDDANRVIGVQTGGRVLIDGVTYHPSGQLTGMIYHDATRPVQTTRTYGLRQRIDTIHAEGFIDRLYTWDGAGNLTTLVDNGTAYIIDYDPLDRLQRVPGPWGTRRYTYDALGNRESLVENHTTATFSAYNGAYLESITVHDLGRIPPSPGQHRAFGYDLVGNRTRAPGATYHWDRSDRMTQALLPTATETYTYDGHLLRVRKQTDEADIVSLYGPDGQLLGTVNYDGTNLRRYVYVGGHVVAEVPLTPSLTRFYYLDYQGSVLGTSRFPSLNTSE